MAKWEYAVLWLKVGESHQDALNKYGLERIRKKALLGKRLE